MSQGAAQRCVCRVVAIEDATHDVRILRLAIVEGGGFGFRAGQYARLAFEGFAPRDYSMASRPDEAVLEFHIRDMRMGGVSGFVARRLEPGERVVVEGPFGEVCLRANHPGPILAIAGGSGLAPIKSIVETALAGGMTQPIHLYFGVRAERDVYLEKRFARLARVHPNLRFVPILSEPEDPTRRRTGRVTDALAEDSVAAKDAIAYLAGPPVMIEAAARLLVALGVAEERVLADPFYSEEERAAIEARNDA